MAEHEMVGWHHCLNGHKFEETSRETEGQGAWPAAVHGVARVRHNFSDNNNKCQIDFIFIHNISFSIIKS